MPVIVIRDDTNFENEMSSSGNNLVVVDFTASWCGPCQRIAPFFQRLSDQYTSGAIVLKVDVDECPESAQSHGVEAMPTFMFFRTSFIGSHSRRGSNSLENKLRELMGSVNESGGQSASSDSGVAGHTDLSAFINKSESECLNESDEHNLSACLTSGSSNYLESDCDEQLIINLAFNQPLNFIHEINGSQREWTKNIKLFINTPQTLDFDQSSSMEPIQKMELSSEDITKGNPIPLRYVKYQNVQNLLIFIENNQSNSEVTRIDYLSLIGSPVNSTNMSDFKRIAGKKGESH